VVVVVMVEPCAAAPPKSKVENIAGISFMTINYIRKTILLQNFSHIKIIFSNKLFSAAHFIIFFSASLALFVPFYALTRFPIFFYLFLL
jgi:hypothetical protein